MPDFKLGYLLLGEDESRAKYETALWADTYEQLAVRTGAYSEALQAFNVIACCTVTTRICFS